MTHLWRSNPKRRFENSFPFPSEQSFNAAGLVSRVGSSRVVIRSATTGRFATVRMASGGGASSSTRIQGGGRVVFVRRATHESEGDEDTRERENLSQVHSSAIPFGVDVIHEAIDCVFANTALRASCSI